MRVLHISASYKPAFVYGGPIVSISTLAEKQQQAGHEVWVYTTKANGSEELNVEDGVNLVNGVSVLYFERLTGDHSHFSPDLLRKLWKSCRSFDVVHIHSWWNLVSLLSMPVLKFREHKAVVLSPRGMFSPYTFQGTSGRIKKLFHRIIGKALLGKVLWHFTSTQEKDEVMKLQKVSSFILPNIIDRISIPYHALSFAPPLTLVFLSRVHHKKGLELTFQAIALLKPACRIELKIFGHGDEGYIQDLREMSSRLGISDQIHWKGWLDRSDMPGLTSEGHVAILNSWNENYGNVVEELLEANLPVILSEFVGAKDVVMQYDLGWVIPQNAEALAALLSSLSADAALIAGKQQNIKQWKTSRPDASELAARYLQAYEKLIV